MTCIVGVEDGGRVFIGGDSAGVQRGSFSLQIRTDPKVFQMGEMVFGFTSSFRMGQLLRFSLKLPRQGKKDDYQYLCTDFINSVKKCLKRGGFATVEKGAESGGTFLMGYRGRLYSVYNDYQVGSVACGYNACGCGADYALGSMYATSGVMRDSRKRITMALQAVSQFSAGVAPPFTIIST